MDVHVTKPRHRHCSAPPLSLYYIFAKSRAKPSVPMKLQANWSTTGTHVKKDQEKEKKRNKYMKECLQCRWLKTSLCYVLPLLRACVCMHVAVLCNAERFFFPKDSLFLCFSITTDVNHSICWYRLNLFKSVFHLKLAGILESYQQINTRWAFCCASSFLKCTSFDIFYHPIYCFSGQCQRDLKTVSSLTFFLYFLFCHI